MRQYLKFIISLTAFFCYAPSVMAAPSPAASTAGSEGEVTDTITGIQYFRRSEASFNNITPDLRILAHKVDSLYRTRQIDSLLVRGNASPDGPGEFNRQLALDRAKSVYNYIEFATNMPDSLITVTSHACDWEDLHRLLSSGDWDRRELASEANRILGLGGTRMVANLRSSKNGQLWKWLEAEVFPLMRATSVIAFFESDPINLTPEVPMFEVTVSEPEEEVEEVTIIEENNETTAEEISDEWRRYLYVKSNLPAWLCLWMNAACEIDIAPHFSATLPVYYSGFNYFTRTLKFRTFAIQPELRYWPKKNNHGFFIGAHFGLAYYNVALKGDYRYQDKDGNTPALGGGLAVGFRFRLNSDPNLSMEATVGGGIYHLNYDIFHNYTNGLLTGGRKRTFYGIDQAALSITYRFGLGHRSSAEQKEMKGGEQ